MKKYILTVLLCIVFGHQAVAEDKNAGENTPELINAKTGTEFSLTLESNRTTGYRWLIDGTLDEKLVKIVQSNYVGPKGKPADLIGAGGKEVWIFSTLAEGKTTILFKYVQPWVKVQKPAKRASFEIMITD
jgi:predicted secreted protein